MAAKRHERTYARRAAVALLYTSGITDESATKIAEEGRYLTEEGPLPEYAAALVRGVESHRFGIDKYLSSTSENWSLARMPIVDLSILRLAVYEMIYVEDVPTSVAINEAVELAKDFGGEDESPRFVNGVLGRIAKRLEAEANPESHEMGVSTGVAVETSVAEDLASELVNEASLAEVPIVESPVSEASSDKTVKIEAALEEERSAVDISQEEAHGA